SFICLFCTHPVRTDVATLSLHDALPICQQDRVIARAAREPIDRHGVGHAAPQEDAFTRSAVELDAGGLEPGAGIPPHARQAQAQDRKSTRLNSSHVAISYAVFCLKKTRW